MPLLFIVQSSSTILPFGIQLYKVLIYLLCYFGCYLLCCFT